MIYVTKENFLNSSGFSKVMRKSRISETTDQNLYSTRQLTVYIMTVSSLSTLLNWFKLVHGLFRQSNMHLKLNFCPDQPESVSSTTTRSIEIVPRGGPPFWLMESLFG